MARKLHDTDRAIGARVRLARIEKRLSQGALGEAIGVSFQQVQKYELGKDRISASQLLNISCVLKTEIGFFYEDVTADAPSADVTALADIVDRRGRNRGETAQDLMLIRLLGQTDPAVKRSLVSLLKTLASPKQAEEPVALIDEAA